MPKARDSYASEFARKGGKARAKKLTPEERRESARKAAQVRWAKERKVSTEADLVSRSPRPDYR